MIERTPTWLLIAAAVVIVAGVLALWALILTGTIGRASNWPWAVAAGAIVLLGPRAQRWARKRTRR